LTPLTPTDGSVSQPYGSDYAQAVAGNFTFQITCQDLDETTAAALYAALNGQYFKAGLNFAYTSKNCSLVVYNTDVLFFVHFFLFWVVFIKPFVYMYLMCVFCFLFVILVPFVCLFVVYYYYCCCCCVVFSDKTTGAPPAGYVLTKPAMYPEIYPEDHLDVEKSAAATSGTRYGPVQLFISLFLMVALAASFGGEIESAGAGR
jgi:hypothetical protein